MNKKQHISEVPEIYPEADSEVQMFKVRGVRGSGLKLSLG
jgi:hypothetical protein